MKKVIAQSGRDATKWPSPVARNVAARVHGFQQADYCDRVASIDDRRGNCRATGATIGRDILSRVLLPRHPGLQEIANLGIVSTLSTQFSRSYFIEPQDESLLDGSPTMSAKL